MSETTNLMPKTYDHQVVEEELYEWWEQNGYFRPDRQAELGQSDADAAPVCHLHAAAQCHRRAAFGPRHHQQRRRPADPLSPHAGPSHAVGPRHGPRRHRHAKRGGAHVGARKGAPATTWAASALCREVWDWKDEYHGRITAQQKRMGISCDWQRERFTLDDGLSEAVLETFIHLYNEGLIYRANYLVNWCPRCESAISDLEVEYEEVNGQLLHLPLSAHRRRLLWKSAPRARKPSSAIPRSPSTRTTSATKHIVGKTALVPMLNREIPVIADDYVDPEFGTGALKVTPGHDPNDYEIGKRHHLPMINIMNKDATLNEEAGPYAGLDRFDAREQAVGGHAKPPG